MGGGPNATIGQVNPLTGQTEQVAADTFKNQFGQQVTIADQERANAQLAQSSLGFLGDKVRGFEGLANQTADKYQTDFSGFRANLNSDFSRFDPRQTGGLDAQSQRLLAQQQQATRNQTAAQEAQNRSALGANNPALAVVNAQMRARSMLNNNSNQLGLAQQQFGRNLAENQFLSNLQNMGNQTQLSQQGFNAAMQSAGNQAIGQQFATRSAPLQQFQDLLARQVEIAKLNQG